MFHQRFFIENLYTYKQQENYLCCDGDFDNDNYIVDDAGSNVSLNPSIIPTTTPTTAAANLLFSLINHVLATSPPPSPSSLSPFNFSYINITPRQTTTDPSTDLDTVISSSSALAINTNFCDNYDTSIPPTTLFERITSYALLSSHVLIPSQFIKLPYGEDNYCTVSRSKQRLDPTSLSIPSTVSKIRTPHLQATPSRCVSSEDLNIYPYYALSSLVDIVLMMILTMKILTTIIIILFIILPMMLAMLPAVIGTQEEQDVFPNDTTINIVGSPTVSMTTALTASSSSSSASSYKKSGNRHKHCLQRQQFLAFIQKLNYSLIGSSCSGLNWITAILYKLSMTIWTLWQFHNDGVCLLTSAWQLLLGVLQ